MFCGKCGKEMSDNAKFCPYCGEKTPNAAVGGMTRPQIPNAAVAGKVRKQTPAMGKGMSEAVLVVCSVLHILMYFKLPFGKLSVVSNYVSMAASYLGIEIPRKLTCTNAIKMMDTFAQLGISDADMIHTVMVIMCGLPIVFSIFSILVNFFSGSKLLSCLSIVASIIIIVDYWIINQVLTTYTEFGYVMGKGWLLACLVSLIQLAAVVMIFKAKKKL